MPLAGAHDCKGTKARSEGTLVMGISAYQGHTTTTTRRQECSQYYQHHRHHRQHGFPCSRRRCRPLYIIMPPPLRLYYPRRRGGASHWQPRRRPLALAAPSRWLLATMASPLRAPHRVTHLAGYPGGVPSDYPRTTLPPWAGVVPVTGSDWPGQATGPQWTVG